MGSSMGKVAVYCGQMFCSNSSAEAHLATAVRAALDAHDITAVFGPLAGGADILIADYKGFSRLGERELPQFMHVVMGRIAEVLNAHGDHVEFRNTWGDAIYAVIDEPLVAARIAVQVQARLPDLPAELVPEGDVAGMRTGVHYGPVWVGTDRITGNRLWYGTELNRTARIEPVTPVRGVCCTENFAAALLIEGCTDGTFTPLGPRQLAKDFGTVELYRLDMA